jgi:NADPH:quinone reductase-like Zn-dependent oxidoreductase
MKAIAIKEHGGPEVLKPEELPPPRPAPGEVRVRVRACALNHLDLWTRSGQAGFSPRFPHVLGCDIAGEVSDPAGVEGLAPGMRVMLSPGTSCGRCAQCLSGDDNACRQYRIFGHGRPGGYAEEVAAPAANLIPIPDSVTFEAAAAFPLVYLTAWHMLVRRAQVKAGEDVLVWAAGSGVGMAAVQIAKLHGARVIATAGGAKVEKARALGADEVLDHYSADVVAEVKRLTGKKGADVVIEHVGAATWERSVLSLGFRGRLVTCGATTGAAGGTPLRHVFAKQLTLHGSYMGSKADLLAAAPAFFAGKLAPVVHEVLPLEEAARAHTMMQASEHFGKIVLRA